MKWVIPRLCRGDNSSLTFAAVFPALSSRDAALVRVRPLYRYRLGKAIRRVDRRGRYKPAQIEIVGSAECLRRPAMGTRFPREKPRSGVFSRF